MANATTYERYSHEGQNRRKKRKKYIENLKKKKGKVLSSKDSEFQAKKLTNKLDPNSSIISENQQTSNTLSGRLMYGSESGKFTC
jgi:hypothetical protein